MCSCVVVETSALLYRQRKQTAVIDEEAVENPSTDSQLFMRLYTGNRRGANERRVFFCP